MTSHIPANLRRLVELRAQQLCEYCLIAEADTYLGCQVDHIISVKHGGLTIDENLAYACACCNRAKGSDLGSLPKGGVLTRFFNPRVDRWSEHFQLQGAVIFPRTEIGEVTAVVFEFNIAERIFERELLCRLGRYPLSQALARIDA